MGHKIDPAVRRRTVEYLVNESPWGDGHLVKDVDFLLENNCYVITPKAIANVMVGAAIACRFMWENTENHKVFFDAVEEGCNPDLAWRLAHIYYKSSDDKYTRGAANHVGSPIRSCSNITNYVAHKITSTGVRSIQSYLEVGSYGGINSMWGRDNADRFDEELIFQKEKTKYIFFNALAIILDGNS